MNPTEQIIEHVAGAEFGRIPPAAIGRAKLSIVDTIATAIGGSGDAITRSVRAYGQLAGESGEATVWCFGDRRSVGTAALINATMARALDFDETYELCINGCHASAYDIPPALALAQRDPSISGAEFLCALVTGMDLHIRLARSVTANAIDTGRDNMVAVWGATAISTRLLRLDPEKTANAFGIAYAQAAGEFQMYEETAHTVALQQGLRARSGIDSALFASVGVNGPRDPFLGKYGFYRAFEPEHDMALLMEGLGEEYLSQSISFKPWPCCKAIHPGIHGMLELRRKHQFTGKDVAAVRIGLNHLAEALVVQPRDQKWNPADAVTARFSLPYAMAVAAGKGDVSIRDMYVEAFGDPEIRRIMAATSVGIDPEIERRNSTHQNSPTRVEVRLRDGRVLSTLIDKPFGHPDNPADFEDGMRKLLSCARVAAVPFPEDTLRQIAGFLSDLENRPNLTPLFALLVSDRAAGGPAQ